MKKVISLLLLMPVMIYAMNIEEAVQNAISTNPKIEVKKEGLSSEKELLSTSKSDYLPSLDLSYSVGPETTKTIANSREDVDVIRQNASVTLTQNIFAGFDTQEAVKQQKALILSADESVKEIANSVALEMVSAYIGVLKSKELLDIAQKNIDVHKKYLDQMKEKIDSGVGRSSDYKQTLSRYENTQSTYYFSEQNYKNSLYEFQRILPGEITVSSLTKPSTSTLPAQNIEDLVSMALKNNPTIHKSNANVKYAKATLERSGAFYYPSLDLQAQTYWNKNNNGYSKDDEGRGTGGNPYVEENGYNAMLLINYNIFNGLSDTSTEESNRHKLLQEKSSLADTKRYIESITKTAYQVFESTKKQLVHIEKNIGASSETVKQYQQEHNLGRRSIIDLLNIELEYNAAQNRKVIAEYNRILAYYQILSFTGEILPTMSVSIE